MLKNVKILEFGDYLESPWGMHSNKYKHAWYWFRNVWNLEHFYMIFTNKTFVYGWWNQWKVYFVINIISQYKLCWYQSIIFLLTYVPCRYLEKIATFCKIEKHCGCVCIMTAVFCLKTNKSCCQGCDGQAQTVLVIMWQKCYGCVCVMTAVCLKTNKSCCLGCDGQAQIVLVMWQNCYRCVNIMTAVCLILLPRVWWSSPSSVRNSWPQFLYNLARVKCMHCQAYVGEGLGMRPKKCWLDWPDRPYLPCRPYIFLLIFPTRIFLVAHVFK